MPKAAGRVRLSYRAKVRLAALAVALLASAVVVASYAYFVVSPAGQRLEQVILEAVAQGGAVRWRLFTVAKVYPVPVWVAIAAAMVVVCTLIRRAWWDGALAVAAAGGAAVLTQVLKHEVFTRPDTGLAWTGPPSLPSGHTTMAAACAGAVLLVAPARARGPLALVGAAWTVSVGLGTIADGWHRPADVVAAVAVVVAVFALAIAMRPAPPGARETNRGVSLILPAMGIVGGGVAVANALVGIMNLRAGTGVPAATALAEVAYGVAGSAAIAFSVLALLAGTNTAPIGRDR